jgi:D-glycero-D-manno-heptose 1,7-bisphosphate phosphatase
MILPMPEARPAIFLDRDGTLMKEVHYCRVPGEVEVYEGAAEALRALRALGFRIVVVTNQSGIGRGIISPAEYEAVNAEFLRQLGPELVDAVYFCPDPPEAESERRKPAPGMLLEAARDLNLDLAASWMVGDKASDVAAGRNAGTRTVLVRTGYGAQQIGAKADLVAKDVPTAAEAIASALPAGESEVTAA